VGRLFYPIANQDGCRPFTGKDFDAEWHKEEFDGATTIIIMVDRGNCHFVTKVENLQKIGARVAIVEDNLDESVQVVMSNDGQGWTINIPSFFIAKRAGDKLKDYMKENPKEKIFMTVNL
jgi:hypothetical protein